MNKGGGNVRNDVNKTEKRYHGRFLTGFSIEMAKTVGARPVEIKRMESACEPRRRCFLLIPEIAWADPAFFMT